MLSTKKHPPQLGLFLSFSDQLNQKHPLYQITGKINWSVFEDNFKIYYSLKMGTPSKPTRLMVSLLILKYLHNLSKESVVEQWAENSHHQYFGGEQYFQANTPCVPTELIAFR